MSYSFKIAWRYFFSKSQQTVINRINAFAFIMVVVATAALFVVLSAFDGLKDFGLSFTESFDPDYEIVPEQGKYFRLSPDDLAALRLFPEIMAAAPEIEEKVFLTYEEKNQVAYLKAVDSTYSAVVPIEKSVALGQWISFDRPEVLLGFGIASSLSVGVFDYNSFLYLTVPKKKVNALLNQSPFIAKPAMVTGLYQINEELDKKYVFSNLAFGQALLQVESDQYTSLAIKAAPEVNEALLLEKIRPLFAMPIRLVSRANQNAALHKMLNAEHLAVYFIFTLVMLIALFNVIGALIMMILDKAPQLKILLAMGATPQGIHHIFFTLGMLICGLGGAIGMVLGILIVGAQSLNPFIFVPGTSLAYPVVFEFKNMLLVLVTLLVLGTISTAWATRGLQKKVRDYAIS